MTDFYLRRQLTHVNVALAHVRGGEPSVALDMFDDLIKRRRRVEWSNYWVALEACARYVIEERG